MNTKAVVQAPRNNLWQKVASLQALSLGVLFLSALNLNAATNAVTSLADSGPGSLRHEIATAAAGDTVIFEVTGAITLTNGELVIDKQLNMHGPGAVFLAVDGNHASRIFRVGQGVVAFISGMTIRHGNAPDGPPGTVEDEIIGTVTPGGPGEPGGAIHTSGTLTLQDCCVESSSAGSGGPGTEFFAAVSAGGDGGAGGGIYNAGTLTLINCVVSGSSAGGGGGSGYATYSPPSGAGGSGGGIYNTGTLSIHNSTVTGNSAGRGADTPREARGGAGGSGGGIWNGGTVVATGSTFSDNAAGAGGRGGVDTLDAGNGGSGGSGGGILSTGSLAFTNCTITGNACGDGAAGGFSVYGEPGAGGAGGSGGGILASGSVSLSSCTVSANACGFGGEGGAGDKGSGPDGPDGTGGGLFGSHGATVRCLNSLVALNAAGAGDVSGMVASLGHNLIGTTNNSTGFIGSGDLVGSRSAPLDPKISPLADNGGQTFTIALLPGSPAVDAAETSAAPPTDQRGIPRPCGLAADIGAFEFCGLSAIALSYGGGVDILAVGIPGQTCCLLESPDMNNWTPLATNQISGDGSALFHDKTAQHVRFYRLMER